MGVHQHISDGSRSYAQWLRRVMTRRDSNAMALIGSSFSEPTELLARTLKENLDDGLPTTYQSVFVNGNPKLKALLAEQYDVDPDQVLCVTGASRALSLIYGTFVKPGERVLVERPCHDLFEVLARDRQLQVDHLVRHPRDGFDIAPDALEQALAPGTRLVVLSNLHNPSGCLLADDRLTELAEVARRHGVLVVVDEVYLGYADSEPRSPSAANLGDNVISINSLTKTHALSSLRCGWIIASTEIMEALRDYNDQNEFGVSKLSHAIAALVLQESEAYARHRRFMVGRSKPLFDHYLGKLVHWGLIEPFLPVHGCIYFPVFRDIVDSIDLCQWLEKNRQVIVAPGEYFGYSGAVRVGMPDPIGVLEQALEAFVDGVSEYAGQVASR